MSDPTTISDGNVVEVRYTLTDADGDIIDESGDEPLEYLHGADNIVQGLEDALAGHSVGDHVDVVVAPEQGYGPRQDLPLQEVPRTSFPADAEIFEGMQFVVEDDDGELSPVWVAGIEDDVVMLDLEHPLAGVNLHFSTDIVSLRKATDEELEHGHPHGPGGHGH